MIFRTFLSALLIMVGMTITRVPEASAQVCGYYVILGCFRDANQAFERLNYIGGPGAGGGAGSQVLDTNQYPNFRNGWFCVGDGPYGSKQEAQSIAWSEMIPDAYVKNGC